MANVETSAESNLITATQMVKAREIDFVQRFAGNIIPKMMEAFGVARKIPMLEGTTLYAYTTTGTLQSGAVSEGEIIPLSQYQRNKVAIGEITLKKWRKAVSAEAIKKSGYDEAVRETDAKMLKDIQKGVRSDFFDFVKGIDGTVVAASTLQAVIAKTWGQLQTLFEDDSIEAIHFINPLTIADYLATATISTQTAFGMTYIEDFLGMGTVVMNSAIPQGQVYSTAKENLVIYYLTMNGDIANAFGLTADETGYVGFKSGYTNEERAQIESLAMSGFSMFVEYLSGVVIGQVDSTPTLGSITVTSAEGAASGKTTITLSGYSKASTESYVYKTAATTAPAVTYGQKLGASWTAIASGDSITATDGYQITVAAIDANGRAQAAGNTTVDAKA